MKYFWDGKRKQSGCGRNHEAKTDPSIEVIQAEGVAVQRRVIGYKIFLQFGIPGTFSGN